MTRAVHGAVPPGGPPTRITDDGWASVLIMAGVVVAVDPRKWTCTVKSISTGKIMRDVDCGAHYLHFEAGEGVYTLPDVGAAVWVARASDSRQLSFIVSYRGVPSSIQTGDPSPDLETGRPRMETGETALLGRSGNGVFIRKGGLTEVFASPVARTVYEAAEGTVHTVAQNLRVSTIPGDLSWSVGEPDEDPEGNSPTLLRVRLKKHANDSVGRVTFQIGSVGTQPREGEPDYESGLRGPPPASVRTVDDPILQAMIFEDGEATVASARFCADQEGNLELSTRGDVQVLVNNNIDLEMSRGGALTASLSGPVDVRTSGSLDMSSAGTSTWTAGPTGLSVTNNGLRVAVGMGAFPVLYDAGFSEALAAAMAEISAVAKAVALPTMNIDNLISLLSSQTFTSTRLSTD